MSFKNPDDWLSFRLLTDEQLTELELQMIKAQANVPHDSEEMKAIQRALKAVREQRQRYEEAEVNAPP